MCNRIINRDVAEALEAVSILARMKQSMNFTYWDRNFIGKKLLLLPPVLCVFKRKRICQPLNDQRLNSSENICHLPSESFPCNVLKILNQSSPHSRKQNEISDRNILHEDPKILYGKSMDNQIWERHKGMCLREGYKQFLIMCTIIGYQNLSCFLRLHLLRQNSIERIRS